jgi:ethanolamine ammonia-lyase large subunit
MQQRELAQLLVCANAFKEGDLLVGGTRDEYERVAARQRLAALSLGDIMRTVLVEDGVSDVLQRSLHAERASTIASVTIGELRRLLLRPDGGAWVRRYGAGLASEVIAAVVRVMSNEELSQVARALYNPLPGYGITIGARQHFGSRIQPNSPGDDEEEILFSILEGLSYGCGDVLLGVNPASDDVETIVRLQQLLQQVTERLRLPTRFCVLSDIVKQTTVRQLTRVDVGFQSLAGTTSALRGMVGLDVDGVTDLARGFDGLYFETGQGSAVTNGAAAGVDMVTLESRAYGIARYIRQQTGAWMIVNDVAGFIGPEVFRTADQLQRACLEDTVMARLHGLTMGLDICSTFHMGIPPARLQQLTEQIVEQAQPAYVMAVAGNADRMLGYLTTSFRQHPRLRQRCRKSMTTPMQQRLMDLGVLHPDGALATNRPLAASLYALYQKAGGDTRGLDLLSQEAERRLAALRERGFDLGYGEGADFSAPPEVTARLEAIYAQARQALYAVLAEAVLRDASPRYLRVRTRALDRDNYLAHPAAGETLDDADAARLRALYPTRRPRIQVVISDGLNANAIAENVRHVLPPLRQALQQSGQHLGATDIVITNGRVRAGYHVGALLGVEVIVHLIGERPGTGLNTLSAYLTYGRDRAGRWRWSPTLDHASTTAVCGIHRQGRHPVSAAAEIVRYVQRMLAERCSGVELGQAQAP